MTQALTSLKTRITRPSLPLLISIGLLTPLAVAEQAAQAQVEDAWMREIPPGQTTSSGFLTLINEGTETIELVAAEAQIAGAVELHTMSTNEEGQMSMRPASGFEVGPGEQRELAPHGDHLMLMRVNDTLTRDDQHPVTLRFSDGSELTIDMAVRAN